MSKATGNHHLLKYRTGEPIFSGVYACRVRKEGVTVDAFVVRNDGRWVVYSAGYEPFFGNVLGWLGPLQRRIIMEE